MIRVSVPATSANLGSGFDAVAISLQLRMEARAQTAEGLHLRFAGSEQPTHGGLAARITHGMELIVEDPQSLNLDVEIDNAIPLGVGLGSSAAALICGAVLAAHASKKEISREDLLLRVAVAEGHADNAASAIYGGLCFVLCDDGRMHTLSMSLPSELAYALVIPSETLDTKIARQALPEHYPRDVLSQSVQRATMLAASLASGNLQHLNAAMRDDVHQRYRSTLYRGLSDALDESDAETWAVLSGSGPSVLVISKSGPQPVAERIVDCFAQAGASSRIVHAEPERIGLIA